MQLNAKTNMNPHASAQCPVADRAYCPRTIEFITIYVTQFAGDKIISHGNFK